MPAILEIIGALLALAYLVLAAMRRWWAWVPYILSSLLYFPVFWESGLMFNAILQLFFVGMGVLGLMRWRDEGAVVAPVEWPANRHVKLVVFWLLAALGLGLTTSYTAGQLTAVADATIALGSIVATYLTVERVVQNWWYWLVIDAAAVITFAFQGLLVSGCLYAVYCVLCVWGLLTWRRAAPQSE